MQAAVQAHSSDSSSIKRERESIHSGQFMVSTFEAEEQDDEDEVAVPIPEEVISTTTTIVPVKRYISQNNAFQTCLGSRINSQQLSIDTSLSKLFQCMSLAYRQKLTSPKWNRFRGIRLRWKDKIRLNNVIWRCWHLQFIKKENTLICQFASPLDVDTHNKPEAVVLEGKYWKRKLAAVTAEYKKWRMFYRNHSSGLSVKDDVEMINEMELLAWNSHSAENMHMMVDEDYMGLMSDTLFSTITNHPFVFPDSREIAKAGLADFIQPSLGPLQPNLDDYMDTFEPLQELMQCKLPTVPEESLANNSAAASWPVQDYYMNNMPNSADAVLDQYQQQQIAQLSPPIQSSSNAAIVKQSQEEQNLYTQLIQEPQQAPPPPPPHPPSTYQSVISKNNKQLQCNKQQQQQSVMRGAYGGYVEQNAMCTAAINDQSYMVAQQNAQLTSQSQQIGYKFTEPTTVPNLKFTSQQQQQQQQQVSHMMQQQQIYHQQHHTQSHYSFPSSQQPQQQKEEKKNVERRPGRGRPRSRSNTRETPSRRPPLISAISDSSLLNSTNSVLLTQLLTNNAETNDALFNQRTTTQSSKNNHRIIKEESSSSNVNNPISILPQPMPVTTNTTLVITAPLQQINPSEQLISTFSNSNSPIFDTSSQNMNSPTSSQGSIGSPNRCDGTKDSRRVGHIHAEQKRRYNIKNGFDMIHTLIPHLNQNPNAKLSKAAMLQKGAEYIRQLRSERNQLNEEMECLRQQIETLNTSISNCQSMLPATGAPVSRRRDTKMQEMFDEYIKKRTMENWKYWIFSLLFRPLLDSFNSFVSTSSLDDLYRSTILWVEQHCTLVDLRPVVINSLKYLSTKTDILAKPEKLPEEAREIVLSKKK